MRLHRTLAAAIMTMLLSPTVLVAAEEGEAGLFSINLGLTVWTIVLFLMLLGILAKYAWGPILGALEARESGIQSALDRAANERVEAEKLLADHRAQLAEARREAQEIVADARAAGEQVRKDIEEKARTEAQGIIESARRDIVRERDEALDAIRRESVDLALAAAGKLIRERLDSDGDRALIQGFLGDLTAPSDRGAEA
jgi:F-type H+-transporting ATPase subunit b